MNRVIVNQVYSVNVQHVLDLPEDIDPHDEDAVYDYVSKETGELSPDEGDILGWDLDLEPEVVDVEIDEAEEEDQVA